MGYRELAPGKWAKPFAYMMLVFTEETLTWQNLFRTADKSKLMVYNHDVWNEEGSLIEWLKYQEYYQKTTINTPSNFEFLTLQDEYNL